MGRASKTASKAIAASKAAKQARVAAPKKISKSMRKLLDKNARKAKARAVRVSKLAGLKPDVMIIDEYEATSDEKHSL